MSSAQCDFCSAPEIKWAYPCRDFEASPGIGPLPGQGSVGAWGACSTCYSLIERGDRAGLAKRSAKRMLRTYPVLPPKLALRSVREMHDKFFANREGKPVPAERGGGDPTTGSVAAIHQLGPDMGAIARALSIPTASIRTVYRGDDVDQVYFERGGTMYRADVRLEGEHDYMRVSEDRSLGAPWDHVRVAIEAGLV